MLAFFTPILLKEYGVIPRSSIDPMLVFLVSCPLLLYSLIVTRKDKKTGWIKVGSAINKIWLGYIVINLLAVAAGLCWYALH